MRSLLGIPAVELKQLSDNGDKNAIKNIYKNVQGKYYTFAVIIKNEEYQGENKVKMNIAGDPTAIDTSIAIRDYQSTLIKRAKMQLMKQDIVNTNWVLLMY